MADKKHEKDQDEEQTAAEDIVVTKYKMSGDIINAVLKELIEKCKPGETVVTLCEFGDNKILEETSRVFKKDKDIKKGLGFPTCISVNNCICHYSPLKSDNHKKLADGDVVKIDMGAHIDGFIAVAAHTFVIGASKDNKVKGRKADVIMAAHMASEAALRLVKPAAENVAVTDAIQKVAESYKCKPVEGMLSHQVRRHVIDGEKAIIQNPTDAQKKEHEKCEFGVHEVYGIDILISTGDGKGRDLDTKTTVFKKKDVIYQLKMKASRQFLFEAEKKFGYMPFSLRLLEDEKKAKMGIVECVKHELMQPYGVLYERDNEFVAQFKYTIVLMPNGPLKVAGLPFEEELYESEHSIEDAELKNLLAASASRKAAKKKKKKAAAQSMAEADSAATGGGE